MMDYVRRFLFEDLDIRGALVSLGNAWHEMRARRDDPTVVDSLLGELTAVTTLIAGNLKAPGRLTFQLQGHGDLSLLLVDCDEQLRLRGTARTKVGVGGMKCPAWGTAEDAAANAEASWVSPALLGNSRCSASIVSPGARIRARCMTFSSSRTLPGHGCAASFAAAQAPIFATRPSRAPCSARKWRASGTMSPGRSRSAGIARGKTLSR